MWYEEVFDGSDEGLYEWLMIADVSTKMRFEITESVRKGKNAS